ncbi:MULTISPECIES: ChaN family lipoprotein [Hafnia]|uniref:Iron-regulated protein n=1 Tax=Hafnia paralvei TaxID=546367 RepID=A0A4Q9EL30_9GAMM|nr:MULTISPECIES: ChaN family lipoprotein [Hafnia]OFS12231.1 iron-regulated protein [Hafnia sp. HMSC23F03]TBM24115.1 iron-regulated protein [Hafnia paralvei]
MKKIGLLAAAFLLSACGMGQHTQTIHTVPQDNIVDLHSGQKLTPQQLLAKLRDRPRVIVGEKHDNLQHHQIEQWLVESLPRQRTQGSVLMEMITPSQQDKVNAVKDQLKQGKSLTGQQITEQTAWQKGWKWELYSGVTTAALAGSYPLLSANLDRSEIKKFYEHPLAVTGALSTQPSVREAIAKTIEESHGGKLEPKQAEAMLAIQQQRDRRMAESLLAAPTPALLIVGGYHANRALGVPLHVEDIAPMTELTVVMLAEEGVKVDKSNADFVWYTRKAKP